MIYCQLYREQKHPNVYFK